MEVKITCPLCEVEMQRAQKQPHEGIRVFRCETCYSEFRQQMILSPQNRVTPVPLTDPEVSCNACFESATLCFNCGDPVCEKHQKNWKNLSEHLSREMMLDIDKSELEKPFCPLCFPLLIKRRTLNIHNAEKPGSPFKNHKTILLLAAVFILSYAAKQCSG